MFERITIHLTDPICKCKTEDLGWNCFIISNGRSALKIFCKTCNIEVLVPSPAFVARFDITNPYPNKKGTTAKLYSIDGGKSGSS